MLVNADFSRRAIVTPNQYQWVASPQAGVERVMLDRLGGEKARATSIVRYAPGSRFPRHQHPGGEEILVLSGTFSEEGGHYPSGWYMRNPPGSSHQPSSGEGAVIFVKLWQMHDGESRRMRVNTLDASLWTALNGRESCPLFADEVEQVSLQRISAGDRILHGSVAGAEVLVLEGHVLEGAQRYERGTWLRLPPGRYAAVIAGKEGTTVYLRTGPFGTFTERKAAPC